MSSRPIEGFHLVRFGTAADQQYLLGDFLSTYDHLIINANMVAHMPSALASFLSIRAKKPYFIDPQTHAFQHDITYIQSDSESKAGEIKKSIQKLIQAFGNPVEACILNNRRSLSPKDLDKDEVRSGFCERVLRFQAESLSKEINKSESAKYYKYLNKIKGEKPKSAVLSPTLLIAPYFYLTIDSVKKWLPVNIDCAKTSKSISKEFDKPLGVQIVISQDLLVDKNQIQQLIDAYAKTKPDVFLVWIDAFSEQKASKFELEAFIDLFQKLGKIAPVVNLYGGFLSIALGRCNILDNLIGVSHGLEYGESRGVVPVGGGIPTAKFYYPALFNRLLFRDALRLVRSVGGFNSAKDFHDKVCGCKMCKEIVVKNPIKDFEEYGRTRSVRFQRGGMPVAMEYPLPETKEKTVKHYMWCKKREYEDKYSCSDIIKELSDIRFNADKAIGLENHIHCHVWADLLQGRIPDV